MFLTEIIYDDDYKKLYFKLEEQARILVLQNLKTLSERYPQLKKEQRLISKKAFLKIYVHIINGLILMYGLFGEADDLKKNYKEIHDFIYELVKKHFNKC